MAAKGKTKAGSNGLKGKIEDWVEANPLRQWRKKNGLTHTQLAPLVGVSVYTLQLWERGGNSPRKAHIEDLERVTKDKLMGKKLELWRSKNPVAA